MNKNNEVQTLDEFIEKEYGVIGTPKRDAFEQGYELFKVGAMVKQARLEKHLTQEQLASRCGTTKGYISMIENNYRQIGISTLQRIVEIGLGGQLQLSIKL